MIRALMCRYSAFEYIRYRVPEEAPKVTLFPNDIVNRVCAALRVPGYRLKTKSRKVEYTIPRYICYALIKAYGPKGTTDEFIARLFNRERSSVTNGLATHLDLFDTNKAYQEKFRIAESKVLGR